MDWNVFPLKYHGVGVEVHERVALPFSPSLISDTFNRWPSLNNLEFSSWKQYASKYPVKPSSLDQRLILRTVVSMNSHTIMLWEDAFCFRSDQVASSALVRGSG